MFYDTGNLMGLFDGLSSSGWFQLDFWCVLEYDRVHIIVRYCESTLLIFMGLENAE